MSRQRFAELLGEQHKKVIRLSDYPQFSFKGVGHEITWEQVEKFFISQSTIQMMGFHAKKSWTDEQHMLLIWTVIKFAELIRKDFNALNTDDWQQISEILEFKNVDSCRFKWLSQKKTNITENMWTQAEDQLLYQTIVENGLTFHWNEIAQEIYNRSLGTFFRKGKQYRERWNNYLNPGMKRGIWSEDEDIKLIELALQVGLRWSLIAKKLLLRTENSVKNRFKSLIRKEKKLQSGNIVQVEPNQVDMKTYEDKQGLDMDQVQLLLSIVKRIRKSQTNRPSEFQNLNTNLQHPVYVNQFHMNYQMAQQQNYQQNMLQMQQIQQMQQYCLFQQQMALFQPQQEIQQYQQIQISQINHEIDKSTIKVESREPIKLEIKIVKQQSYKQNNQFNKFQQSPVSPQFSNRSYRESIDEVKEEIISEDSDKEPELKKQIIVPCISPNHSTNSNFSLEVLRVGLNQLYINDKGVKTRKPAKKSNSIHSNESDSPGLQHKTRTNPQEIRQVRGGSQSLIVLDNQEGNSPSGRNTNKLSRFFYEKHEEKE